MQKATLMVCSLLLFTGCSYRPQGIQPVEDFSLESYLGHWYEIARLDHRFERGLSRVTANYSLRDDGGVNVVNRGFKEATGRWQEASGRAYFLGEPQVASLKVTFFWPFYGGYHVIALDRKEYRYALVCGPNRDYLWILARTPQLEQTVIDQLLAKAQALGFATRELIFVEHQE